MSRVILGVTGSVAAIKTPELFAALSNAGHDVRIVATEPSLHFFDPSRMLADGRLFRDGDEWPAKGWLRDDPVLHIEFRNWADLLLVAPLDANSLGKFALGLCDNFLTCLFRAWDFQKPVVLAPAMNTRMWRSPVTLRHFRMMLEDRGDGLQGSDWTLDDVARVFAAHAPGILVVEPQSKRLACGDIGIGAMAEVLAVADTVRRMTAAVEPP